MLCVLLSGGMKNQSIWSLCSFCREIELLFMIGTIVACDNTVDSSVHTVYSTIVQHASLLDTFGYNVMLLFLTPSIGHVNRRVLFTRWPTSCISADILYMVCVC
jgi:hypothetical protein